MKDTPYLSDLISIMREEIKEIGFDSSAQNLLDDKVVQRYCTLCRRLITEKSRKVHKAEGFYCPPELEAGLKILEEKFSCGDNVNPYQSRGIQALGNASGRFNDGLLFDWGIHHFHLGVEPVKDKFIQRTGDLLFAVVKEDAVYFISIAEHKTNWTNKDLLEIVQENWPSLLEGWQIDTPLSSECNLSEDIRVDTPLSSECNYSGEDIRNLRNAGINVIISLDSGNSYLGPGGGITTDGSMALASMDRNRIIHKLRSLKGRLDKYYPNNKFTIVRKDSNTLSVVDLIDPSKVFCTIDFPSLKLKYGSFSSL